jgi:hypothetical protein
MPDVSSISTQRTVIVQDVDGRPAYQLTEKDGLVKIARARPFSWSDPEVPLFQLRNALEFFAGQDQF